MSFRCNTRRLLQRIRFLLVHPLERELKRIERLEIGEICKVLRLRKRSNREVVDKGKDTRNPTFSKSATSGSSEERDVSEKGENVRLREYNNRTGFLSQNLHALCPTLLIDR